MRSRLVNAFLVVAAVAGLAHAAPNAAITITVRVVGPPNIDSLSVSSGPGWSQIQLAGVFFGDTRGTSTVAFGAGQTESPEYLAWSDAAIACRVPEGLPLGVNYATVTVGGIISNAVAFNVTAPTELCVDAANGTGTENGTARWPFSTVGEAVQASAGGEIVRVAAGTYRETVTLANTILYLRGGYVGGADYASVAGDFGDANRSLDRVTNATAIDGERARRCILLTGCPGGELSGIIIRNGATGASGAGVSCDTSSVVIQACTIEGNAATGDGGGLYALSSTPTLSYSIIRGNTAGGVGGGVALDGGGGDLAHNAIFGNQATQGGGLCLSAAATTVRNCVVTGNESAGAGGGVAVRTSGSATLTHDTIAHNRGGGVLCQDAVTPALKHLILWGNQAAASPGIACVGGAAPTVSYSNTQGALPSAAVDAGENRSEDPLFVDPGEWVANAWDQGDYHLKSEAGHWTETGWVADPLTSPCVDVGDLGDGVGAEPAPNGACRNLGAFGSTAQASKSPPVSVHVLAADPSAAETLPGDTPNTGLFRIRRIGRIGPIAVSFLRAGTATYGATGDYTLSVGGVP
ncbi:MAG: hypothetical protein FJ291_14155, partial [Planctomycetes bacterium]|nr:hypothetical protein [Planctomycetota bacterium]